jgi:conjugative transfer signal peptidase TraF
MNRATIVFALAAAALFWGAALLGHAHGFRINHTPSLPVGLWRIEPSRGPIERGQIVSFCPPDTPFFRQALARGWFGQGRCHGEWEPLLKPVIAIPGDRIALSATGITVNGQAIPDSARMALVAGEIPTGSYSLEGEDIWVLSTAHPRSLDSRYFGAMWIGVGSQKRAAPNPESGPHHVMRCCTEIFSRRFGVNVRRQKGGSLKCCCTLSVGTGRLHRRHRLQRSRPHLGCPRQGARQASGHGADPWRIAEGR